MSSGQRCLASGACALLLTLPATAATRPCSIAVESWQRELEKRIFAAINNQRLQNGIPALAWDEAVADQAREHSCRMAKLGFFSHNDPERGSSPERLSRAGIQSSGSAENIYQESGPLPAGFVGRVVRSWMRHGAHRANILDRFFDYTGVGIVSEGDSYFVSQIFIAALPQPHPPAPSSAVPGRRHPQQPNKLHHDR